jgi:hypothetical protein
MPNPNPTSASAPASLPPDLPDWRSALADSDLRMMAGDAVFKRGQTYAASGAVQDLELLLVDKGLRVGLSATVRGTQRYTCEVLVTEDTDVEGDCDCPHAVDGYFCKHQVALALTLRGLLGGEAPVHSDEAEKKVAAAAKRAQTQADNRAKLQAFVQVQSAAALAERVWQWAQSDREVMADLKAWAAQAQAAENPKSTKTAISELLKTSGFLDWRGTTAYAQRAHKVLPLLEQALQRDPEQARALCEHALLRIYRAAAECDDSSGTIGQVMRAMQSLLVRSLKLAQPPASWLANWFALLEADPWGLWNERALLDAAGPALQEAYSRKVLADWQAYRPPAHAKQAQSVYGLGYEWDYARTRLRTRYLEDLQHQGDPVAAIEAMRSSLQDASEYGELVAYCEKVHKFREALQFAQAAYKQFPEDRRCENDLLRCYERDGWDAEALALRRKQLEASPTPAHFLAALQAAQSAGKDRAAYRQALYQWAAQQELGPPPAHSRLIARHQPQGGARNVGTRAQWLLAEGLVDEALALVQAPHVCHPNVLQDIARKLPAAQNEAAIALLLRVFAAEMPHANTPYREVLGLVHDICKRMDSQPRKHWLLHLHANYKAKRNFIKGLEGL